MLRKEALLQAFLKVKRAKGAPGIDGQSIASFDLELSRNLDELLSELKNKSYFPLPVKGVCIPKPDGGVRKLGIPAVRDRIVQQALLDILHGVFDSDFHPSSYGYRPGRSCHQAISKASLFIRKHSLKWVVDLDISKCFDSLDHDLIMDAFKSRIRDGSILSLIKSFLKSGVMRDDCLNRSEKGSPQGGVISPLIANVYLDSFDQHMMKRGHRIVRYADDILILCKSKAGAVNAMKVAKTFLEGDLRLGINEAKSRIGHSSLGVKFLGVVIYSGYTIIHPKRLKAFKDKVRALTKRCHPFSLADTITLLNPVIRGFGYYFKLADCRKVYRNLMNWIRRRVRARQMCLWKKASRLHRRLRQLGYRGSFTFLKMRSWRSSGSPLCHMALSVGFLHNDLNLFDLNSINVGSFVPDSGI